MAFLHIPPWYAVTKFEGGGRSYWSFSEGDWSGVLEPHCLTGSIGCAMAIREHANSRWWCARATVEEYYAVSGGRIAAGGTTFEAWMGRVREQNAPEPASPPPAT